MERTIVVLAEPGVLERVGLGKCVSIEKEEMAEGLLWFEGEVRKFERCCGDSGDEGHDDNRRIDRAFIPIFLW